MANYPLHHMGKGNKTLLGATHSSYSDDYAESMCDFHLHDEIYKDEKNSYHKYYRLYAYKPHSIEMGLQYEIYCPECSMDMLKQVGRCLNSHELGLYVCPMCDKRRVHK